MSDETAAVPREDERQPNTFVGDATIGIAPEQLEEAGYVRAGFVDAVTRHATTLGRNLTPWEYGDLIAQWAPHD